MRVYRIRNIKNNHCYIGSETVLDSRRRTHFGLLGRQKHHSIYFQRAYNKYGKNSFIFEYLTDELEDNHELLFWEQRFINNLNPEYNIRKLVTTKKSGAPSNETIEKIRKTLTGRQLADDHKRNISKSSPNRGKISDKVKPVICIESGIVYSSITLASQAVNLSRRSIRRACLTDKGIKGMAFKYINT